MFRIATYNKISTRGLDRLPRENYEVASGLTSPDAILVRSATISENDINANLKAIARAGAGTNNIPVNYCSEKGIIVFNTPGANANGVKELTIAALIMSTRNIFQGMAWVQGLKNAGDEVTQLVEKGKSDFTGGEIKGKILGVIGLGAIGSQVANDSIALGMKVIGYDEYLSVDAAWGLSNATQRAENLESLLAKSDFITVHVPLTDQTRGLINHERMSHMKKGAVLINLSRNGIVNNEDLRAAISDGIISVYITDFPDSDLLNMPNVICIPHLGASTREAEENCAEMAADQLRNFLEFGNIKNSVNFPDCRLEWNRENRLVIANRNIPNMVGQITAILAEEKINIADMLNKHRDQYAYNIIDVNGTMNDSCLDKIRRINGVLNARIIRSEPDIDKE